MARIKKNVADPNAALRKELELRKLAAETVRSELLLKKALDEHNLAQAESDHNHIYTFWSEVNDESVKECIDQLSTWHRQSPRCPITIVLNSEGGTVIDGLALYDFLMGLRRKRHHLTIKILGEAASMGGVLVQAGNVRIMGRHAFLMIHEISYGVYGKSYEHRDELALIKTMESKLLKILCSRSIYTVRELRKEWERKDLWLDAKKALERGFVDKIE